MISSLSLLLAHCDLSLDIVLTPNALSSDIQLAIKHGFANGSQKAMGNASSRLCQQKRDAIVS